MSEPSIFVVDDDLRTRTVRGADYLYSPVPDRLGRTKSGRNMPVA